MSNVVSKMATVVDRKAFVRADLAYRPLAAQLFSLRPPPL